MKPLLSVIVPAYNSQETLNRCLDSILSQTYDNLEILVVNDGSTDTTRDILCQYEALDRVTCFHVTNGGLSSARNIGMDAATGEYLAFVDSDDHIAPDMFRLMMEEAIVGDCDIVACDVLCVYPDHDFKISSKVISGDTRENLMTRSYIAAWNKIYKRNTVGDLRFKVGAYYEDILFCQQYYLKCERISSVPYYGYYYVQTPGSITYTYNDKLFDMVYNMNHILDYYKSEGAYDTYRSEVDYSYIRYLYATFMKRIVKTKDWNKSYKAYKMVRELVKKNVPNYRRNKYIRKPNPKNIYFWTFSPFTVYLLFIKEKNKSN